MDNRVSCTTREKITKGENHRLRTSGKVPGVIYGLNQANVNVEFGSLDILHALEVVGEHGVVEIDRTGNTEKVLIKEVQHDPLTRQIIHVDLQRIDGSKRVHTTIPIHVTGEELLWNKDAVYQNAVDQVEVECQPDKLPKYFSIDISNKVPGSHLTFRDLEISEEISIIGDVNTIIGTIARMKHNKHDSGEAEEGTEAAIE